MGLSIEQITKLVKKFGGDGGQIILQEILGGNNDMLGKVARNLGVDPKDLTNLDDIQKVANTYNKNQYDVTEDIKHTMMGSPADWAIRTGAAVAENSTDAISKILGAKGMHLANALLAAKTASPQKEARFGKSPSSMALEMAAQKEMYKGEKNAAIWQAIANAARDLSSTYKQRDDMARSMAAAEKAQLPGAFYTGMASRESTGERMSRRK